MCNWMNDSIARFAALVAASIFCLAEAQSITAGTTYSDGGNHNIPGPAPDITIANGTTLIVAPGAAISAASPNPGILTNDGSLNHVVVSGGTIVGGANPASFGGFGGSGINMFGGTLNISGGDFTGGAASFVPGSGVQTLFTTVTISGGNFFGGNMTGNGYPGRAAELSGAEIQITGGTFHPGSHGPN